VSNTNPQVILFVKYWMVNILKLPKEKLRVALHLYKDMNVGEEIEYWSNKLDISANQFRKPYIKSSNRGT
jgi:hypothetical protein